MANSPLAYTRFHQRLFRFMNILDFETSSSFWTKYHGPVLYIARGIFLHFASILQCISLFTCGSIIEFSTVLFVATIWVNISIKGICFVVKKREIVKLWQQLDDEEFKAKTIDDFQ